MYTDGRRSAAKRLPLTFSLVQKTGAGQLHVQIFQVQWFSIKNLLCTPERSYEDDFDVFIKSFLCINWVVCPSTSLEADVDSIYFLALQRFFFGVVLDDSPALAYAFCL